MKKLLFTGVATALYTPITNGEIDFEETEKLIGRQIAGGVSALVLLGTTGESATVTREERKKLISFALSRIKKRAPLIVGTGSNSTQLAAELTKEAKDLGADGALVVTPYYNKCTEEGAYLHYRRISEEGLPFLVYNVPSRTTIDLSAETLKRISELPCFCGIKEASSDEKSVSGKMDVLSGSVPFYSGSDEKNLWFYRRGAAGAISVASNIKPKIIADIYNNFKNNYIAEAERLDRIMRPLYAALFCEINPIPLKAMIGILYGKGQETRLPLTEAKKENVEYFRKLLHAGQE